LIELGYDVDMRAVRLSQPIRRLGENQVLIQFERDLKQEITVRIVPDREIEGEREEETPEAETSEGEPEATETPAEPAAAE
ncbi:MAG: 50S ribosomal L9 C-terminal domain-containing protein, partial [Phycisphaerales bacterium]